MAQTAVFSKAGVNLLRLLAPPEREERRKTSHYASSLEGCPRKEYFKWLGAPETNPPSTISKGKMQAGVDAHQLFGMRLERVPDIGLIECERSVELVDSRLTYPIHGRLDFCFPLNGEDYIIEYKSTQYRTTDRALEAPFVGHLYQMWAYMQIESADHYYLVYEDRGSKLGCEYEIAEIDGILSYRRNGLWTKTDLSWQAVIEKLAMIEGAVGEEKPPTRIDPLTEEDYRVFFDKTHTKIQQTKVVAVEGDKETFRSHWMCMDYCSYRDHCWLDKEVTNGNG